MKIQVTLDEKDLKQLVLQEVRRRLDCPEIKLEDINIETKSKQNFKSKWEAGAGFRATVDKLIQPS